MASRCRLAFGHEAESLPHFRRPQRLGLKPRRAPICSALADAAVARRRSAASRGGRVRVVRSYHSFDGRQRPRGCGLVCSGSEGACLWRFAAVVAEYAWAQSCGVRVEQEIGASPPRTCGGHPGCRRRRAARRDAGTFAADDQHLEAYPAPSRHRGGTVDRHQPPRAAAGSFRCARDWNSRDWNSRAGQCGRWRVHGRRRER